MEASCVEEFGKSRVFLTKFITFHLWHFKTIRRSPFSSPFPLLLLRSSPEIIVCMQSVRNWVKRSSDCPTSQRVDIKARQRGQEGSRSSSSSGSRVCTRNRSLAFPLNSSSAGEGATTVPLGGGRFLLSPLTASPPPAAPPTPPLPAPRPLPR